eukprot:CAMPEP_0197043826 /NCGR_PEP_ID=MMETSP1384-20130603/20014_1 /TAXON_ID=29189 /ORGANISM="Ammonia sp." /LENGTH=316 /DNA_ID=CAMNT_0042475191 /DNA_START=528 /DNA_END=1481 /DNA_ORIENTATION=-
MKHILQYNLNHNTQRSLLHHVFIDKQETLKRIVATNYYLMSAFKQEIEECDERAEWEAIFVDETMYNDVEPSQVIDNVATIHNEFNGQYLHRNSCQASKLDSLNWTDIGFNIDKLHVQCMISLSVFLLYIVYNSLMIICIYLYAHLMHELRNEYVLGLFVVYVLIEVAYIPLNVRFYHLASYSCYILPGVINIKSFEWLEKFDTDTMMDDIQTVYDIMYQTTNEIQAVWQHNIHPDIAQIITQYLYYKLPANIDELEDVIAIYNESQSAACIESVDGRNHEHYACTLQGRDSTEAEASLSLTDENIIVESHDIRYR